MADNPSICQKRPHYKPLSPPIRRSLPACPNDYVASRYPVVTNLPLASPRGRVTNRTITLPITVLFSLI